MDWTKIRSDFPALDQMVHGKPLAYLDSAASTQKPRAVIEAVRAHYVEDCSNVHRGVHTLSQRSTVAYEDARKRVAAFLGISDLRELVWTKGTTESINLVAQTFGRANIGPGDEILVTEMEHHSNIVPWQLLAEEKGATVKAIPVEDDGSLSIEAYKAAFTNATRLVATVHISNALGTINPVKEMAALAHERGVPILIDGAQAVAHGNVNVKDLDCDFYCFGGHKLYGPTGVGVLYGKLGHLEAMPPWQGGGDMIRTVSFSGTSYAEPPAKFEAGTPNIAGSIGLGAAVDYVSQVGREAILTREAELLAYGTEKLLGIDGLRLIGTAPQKASVLSFTMEGVHPHDLGMMLDMEGVAVRTGHHCAQPLMQRFGITATTRASIGIYTNHEDLDRLTQAIEKARELLC